MGIRTFLAAVVYPEAILGLAIWSMVSYPTDSATTELRRIPISGISTSTTSPG